MVDLAKRDGASVRCLAFIILTAACSGEARGAFCSEIAGDTWTVPAARMKHGLTHRVSLSHQEQAVLETMLGLQPKLVFPSPQLRKGKSGQMSDAVFKALSRACTACPEFFNSRPAHACEVVSSLDLTLPITTQTGL